MNNMAWVVALTYLRTVVKCESLLGGHGKVHFTVISTFYVSLSKDMELNISSLRGNCLQPVEPKNSADTFNFNSIVLKVKS